MRRFTATLLPTWTKATHLRSKKCKRSGSSTIAVGTPWPVLFGLPASTLRRPRNHSCPRCCDKRGRTPIPSRTSSRAGSRTGSHARPYRTYSARLCGGLSLRPYVCFFFSGLDQPLFATRWSSPFIWRS